MPEPTAPLLPWTRWMVPSEAAVALAAILAAYVAAIGLLRPREARGERLASSQALAFAGGLLSLFVVLTGPLADLAGTFLFSAHMVQHLTLSLAAPPLLLLGTPSWLIRPLLVHSPLVHVARILTRPAIAFAAFSVVFVAWHLPVLYNLALAYRGVQMTPERGCS